MFVETFLQDLRIGFRVLTKEKSFCFLAIFVLALGIGAVTTQYAVVNGVLLRGFTFPAAERLVDVQLVDPEKFEPNNFNSRMTTADFVELHTGRYANATRSKEADAEFDAITQSAKLAYKLGMGVNAGHGLNYRNVKRLTHIPEIVEYNIGHSIVARAVLIGIEQAVKEMKVLVS